MAVLMACEDRPMILLAAPLKAHTPHTTMSLPCPRCLQQWGLIQALTCRSCNALHANHIQASSSRCPCCYHRHFPSLPLQPTTITADDGLYDEEHKRPPGDSKTCGKGVQPPLHDSAQGSQMIPRSLITLSLGPAPLPTCASASLHTPSLNPHTCYLSNYIFPHPSTNVSIDPPQLTCSGKPQRHVPVACNCPQTAVLAQARHAQSGNEDGDMIKQMVHRQERDTCSNTSREGQNVRKMHKIAEGLTICLRS